MQLRKALDKCNLKGYICIMIENIRHKGLKALYEKGTTSGVEQSQVFRLKRRLVVLNHAKQLQDLNIPGFKLHAIKGDYKEYWAIWVTGNWRLIFRFEEGNVFDLLDYH